MIESLHDKKSQLKTVEIKNLECTRRAIEKTLDEIADWIAAIWKDRVDGQKEGIRQLAQKVLGEIDDARSVVQDSASARVESARVIKQRGFLGLIQLLKRLLDQSPDKAVSSFDHMHVQRAIDNAFDKIGFEIQAQFDRLFDLNFVADATNDLRIGVANLVSETANAIGPSVKRSLARAVEKIADRARVDIGKHGSWTMSIRSGIEIDANVDDRISQARNCVNTIRDEARKRLTRAREVADQVFAKAATDLMPVATGDLETYYERLGNEILERERALQQYERADRDLQQQRQRLVGGVGSGSAGSHG